MNETRIEAEGYELVLFVLQKWWVIVLTSIVFATATLIITTSFVDPVYEAETVLFIGKEKGALGGLGISLSELEAKNKLVTDYKQIVGTRLLVEEVLKKFKLSMSVGDFKKGLVVNTIEDSRFFTLGYQSKDPVLATNISNELATQLTVVAAEIVDVESIRIIDKAIVPKDPVKPKKLLLTAAAFIIGAMIGMLAVFIMFIFNNTIKKEEDVEKLLGLPVVGNIPKY